MVKIVKLTLYYEMLIIISNINLKKYNLIFYLELIFKINFEIHYIE